MASTEEILLDFLPKDAKENRTEKFLQKNAIYQKICLQIQHENKMCTQIAFLISAAPIFTRFLKLLQSCGPLVHVLYTELKETLILVMNRFWKNELVAGKAGKDLVKVDLSIAENLKPLTEVEIGKPTKQILQRTECQTRSWNKETNAKVLHS